MAQRDSAPRPESRVGQRGHPAHTNITSSGPMTMAVTRRARAADHDDRRTDISDVSHNAQPPNGTFAVGGGPVPPNKGGDAAARSSPRDGLLNDTSRNTKVGSHAQAKVNFSHKIAQHSHGKRCTFACEDKPCRCQKL